MVFVFAKSEYLTLEKHPVFKPKLEPNKTDITNQTVEGFLILICCLLF